MPVTNDSLATALIGKTVRNSAGETLGRVEDLVVDASNGRILFVILSFAGLSIPNDRFVAVPWGKFGGLLPGRDYLLLDVEKNILVDAPWFERNRWPDTSDAGWRSRVYNHYGYRDPIVIHDDREVRPRRGMSALAAVFLVVLLAAILAFTYMVATRGWEQAKAEVLGSMHSVGYAMKDASSDAALTAKVKTALSLNRRLPANAINVDSQNGVVTLRGDVSDDDTRAIALSVVQDVPGVQEVHDHLFVASHER